MYLLIVCRVSVSLADVGSGGRGAFNNTNQLFGGVCVSDSMIYLYLALYATKVPISSVHM